MTSNDILDALTPVVEALEYLGVKYLIGGSVASSYYGAGRSTFDVDVIADLVKDHIPALVAELEGSYYVDTDMIVDAVRSRSSFNVIHMPTMLKVDFFVAQESDFDRIAFSRVQEDVLGDEPDARRFLLASPEDVILRKLQWFDAGGRASECQWNDVLGVLKVQSSLLDLDYLLGWATKLGLGDLLNQALTTAGLSE